MIKLSLLVAIVALISYEVSNMYVPVEFKEKFMYKFKSFFVGLGANIGRIGNRLNLGSEIVLFRKYLNSLAVISYYYDYYINRQNESVKTEDKIFGNGINVRIYTPNTLNSSEKYPFMIYFHGGCYLFGNLAHHDQYIYELSKKTNLLIISVDYNLAPENAFPGPLNDCLNVTEYVLNNYKMLNLDTDKYILAGDSSGGHAAAYITQFLTINGKPPPKLQLLIYPWVQMFNFTLPSDLYYYTKIILAHAKFPLGKYVWWLLGITEITEEMEDVFLSDSHVLLLEDEELKKKYRNYLDINLIPEQYKTGRHYYQDYKLIKEKTLAVVDQSAIHKIDKKIAEKLKILFTKEASPGLADDEILKQLPKTYFVILEWDILKDQGLIYSERLRLNKVCVEVAFYENIFHGSVPFIDDYIGYTLSRKILDDTVEYIRRNL